MKSDINLGTYFCNLKVIFCNICNFPCQQLEVHGREGLDFVVERVVKCLPYTSPTAIE